MQSKLLVLPLLALLEGCSQSDGINPPAQPSGEAAAVSVFGTPFLIAFKIPLCIGSLLLAAPAAGASAIIPPDELPEQSTARQVIADGLRQNCGPPYLVAPPRS